MKKGTVLILDDEIENKNYKTLKKTMKEKIEKTGFEPLFETDSTEWLKFIEDKTNNIKLIFLDLIFKDQKLQGGDILRIIKEKNIEIPVIVFSTKKPDEERKNKEAHPKAKGAKSKGAIEYLWKSPDLDALTVDKIDFLNKEAYFENLIIRSQDLENSDCELVLDCKKKTLSISSKRFAPEENPIFKHTFNKLSPTFATDDIALNRDTLIFRLIYDACNEEKKTKVVDLFPGSLMFRDLSKDYENAINAIKRETLIDDETKTGIMTNLNKPLEKVNAALAEKTNSLLPINLKNNAAISGLGAKENYDLLVSALKALELPESESLKSDYGVLIDNFIKKPTADNIKRIYDFVVRMDNGSVIIASIKNNATSQFGHTKIVSTFNNSIVKKQSQNRLIELLQGYGHGGPGGAGGQYRLLIGSTLPPMHCDGIEVSQPTSREKMSADSIERRFQDLEKRVLLLEKEIAVLKKKK